jgi:hypothetical protein
MGVDTTGTFGRKGLMLFLEIGVITVFVLVTVPSSAALSWFELLPSVAEIRELIAVVGIDLREPRGAHCLSGPARPLARRSSKNCLKCGFARLLSSSFNRRCSLARVVLLKVLLERALPVLVSALGAVAAFVVISALGAVAAPEVVFHSTILLTRLAFSDASPLP